MPSVLLDFPVAADEMDRRPGGKKQGCRRLDGGLCAGRPPRKGLQ